MGRPVKNNCDYFPHFTTMRNHKKVKSLRAKFGQVLGYAFWSMFVEYLTEQDGTEMEFSDLEIEMFSGELGVSATEIRSMIDYCIKIELLFLTDDNFIYSDSLNELLQPVFDKRQNAKERSKTRKRHNNGRFSTNNSTTLGVSATETPQIEVKKSKVNKKEENINKEAETFLKFPPEYLVSPDIVPLEFDLLFEVCFKDEMWLDSICMIISREANTTYTHENVISYKTKFKEQQISSGLTTETIKEFKQHYSNYVKKQIKQMPKKIVLDLDSKKK